MFITGQSISLFGSSLVQYAILWHITLSTKSGSYTAISIICGFVPMFLLSPFAGVWADRYNRKNLIVFSDGGIALCTLGLALAFSLGYRDIWLFFVASAIRALGSAIQMPSVNAMIPDLVPEEQLTRVNGINGTIQSALMLVSPMISGALMAAAPLQVFFFIDAATAALAIAVLLIFLRIEERHGEAAASGADYFADLRKGFGYISNHPFLKSLFGFTVLFCFAAAPAAFLTPLQVARTFGDDVWRLTAIEITFSVGMMLGGIAIATWGGFKSNRLYTMAVASGMLGACTLALGFPGQFWLYLAFMTVIGLALPFFNTPAVVLMQERVEPEYLGRVFGVLTMINSSMMPIAMLAFGPLADVVAIEWQLIGTGAVMLGTVPLMLKSRPLREAGLPKAPPSPAE